jgi:hypothetical protein
MRPRGVHPLLLLGLLAGLPGLLFAGALVLGDTGAIALVPFFGLLIPLLLGRYVGADHLERLRERRALPRAPRTVALWETAPRTMLRNGLVLASGLAVRPPPAAIRVIA